MVRRAENAAERGFLLHVFHRLHKGRDVLYAVGKLESGATFGLMDTRWRPFFYCRVSDRDKVAQRAHGAELVDGELATVDGERVLRVECARVGALRRLARQLEQDGIRTYEADLNFGLHCLMEAGLRGGVEIDGAWQPGTGVDRIYVDPQLMPTDYEPELALLVLDIETAPEPWRSTGCRWWAADRVINTASRRSISSERRRTTIPTICSAIPTSARCWRRSRSGCGRSTRTSSPAGMSSTSTSRFCKRASS
ncbi:MAG: hypothetical protein QGH25_20825, partial [Candidatus Latescibacteria bacterium]|nr:hypothetical protein [Candidatus Latescibacterota bacterium]